MFDWVTFHVTNRKETPLKGDPNWKRNSYFLIPWKGKKIDVFSLLITRTRIFILVHTSMAVLASLGIKDSEYTWWTLKLGCSTHAFLRISSHLSSPYTLFMYSEKFSSNSPYILESANSRTNCFEFYSSLKVFNRFTRRLYSSRKIIGA